MDEKSSPLQYVNIYLENSEFGTITNTEGKFNFIVPFNQIENSLIIKHLGYRTDTIKVSQDQTNYNIQLQALSYPIDEISIYPDDSVVRILKKAIQKIPDNYLGVNSRQTGFYREYLKHRNNYLYFGEALIDFFQPSYKNKADGTIQILKSRINKSIGSDSIPQLYFYGGPTLHVRSDLIKQRSLFFNPSEFENYNYHIDSVIQDKYKTFWKVGVSPAFRSKSKYRGYFILDPNSLIIEEIHFQYTKEGITARTKSLNQNLECISRQIIILYSGGEKDNYLKYLQDNEQLRRKGTNTEYIQLNEYLTTTIDTINNSPIPYDQQNNTSTIFLDYAIDYSDSDWKDYTELKKDSSMTGLSLIETSENESTKILSQCEKLSLKEKAKKVLSRFAVKSLLDLSIDQKILCSKESFDFSFIPTPAHSFPINIKHSDEKPLYAFGMAVGFRVTNQLVLSLESESQLSTNTFKSTALKIGYDLPIKSYGKRLFISPTLALGIISYGMDAGKFNNPAPFYSAGKKFNAEKISFAVGKAGLNFAFGVSIKKEISRTASILLSPEYHLFISSNPRLFINEESGFWLTRKQGSVEFSTSNHFDLGDRTLEDVNGISLKRIGFRISLEFSR